MNDLKLFGASLLLIGSLAAVIVACINANPKRPAQPQATIVANSDQSLPDFGSAPETPTFVTPLIRRPSDWTPVYVYSESWDEQMWRRREEQDRQRIIDELVRANDINQQAVENQEAWQNESLSVLRQPRYELPPRSVSVSGTAQRIGNTIYYDFSAH